MKTTKSDLTAARLREVLHYDPETGVFTWRVSNSNRAVAGSVAGSKQSNGYLAISVDGERFLAHRLAWLYVNGVWPPEDVDHVNRVRLDNWIDNIRPASRTQNNQNTKLRADNTSGTKGVNWLDNRGKWQARIGIGGRILHLGVYVSLESAIAARKAAEARYHPFAAKGAAHA